MKLHCTKFSTTSRPLMLFIAENGIDIELVDVDLMTGEHMKEPFSLLNPSKQVPVLDDGGFILTEGSAILKYLADKIDSPAYPKELKARAHVNEVMDWLNTGLYREYGYHLIYAQIFPHHARSPEDANKVTVEWGKQQSAHWLGVLDNHWLGGNKYVCGNEISIADYMGASYIAAGNLISVDLSGYANITNWLNTMRGLSNWGSVNDVIDGYAESLQDQTFISLP